MKCPNCQTELTGEEKFCIKCGTKIEAKTETEAKPEEKKPAEEAPKAETAPQDKPEVKAEEKPADKSAQPVIVTPKPMNSEAAEEKKEQPAKEPVKIEPVKPELKAEPDIKDPESMIVKAAVSAPPVFCIKCGAKMQPTAKFCTKCGTPVDSNQKPAGASAALASTAPKAPEAPVAPVAPAPQAPVQSAPAEKPAGKKSSKGLIILIILAICAIIVAILLALKSAGVFANIGSGNSQNTEEDAAGNNESGDEDGEEGEEGDEGEEEDPAAAEARRQEINDLMDQIDAAVAEGDQSDILNGSYEIALDGFITLASKYELADDVSKEAAEVFEKYAQQTRNSIALLDGQKVSSGLYTQSRMYYDDILSYANAMSNAGIKFDDCGIQAESDALIETYRAKYIYAINEITNLESWSRDEAWALMEDAASLVDEDGNRILFDEDNLDDPMRLRYIYALAWKTRKDIETGIANGSMTYEDALDKIDEVLRDTDYNLMLLHDGIYYCDKAGIDSAPYKVAFDNEIEKIQEFDKIIIVLDPAKADETHILMNRYWAFNDISSGAETAYQVSYNNGTSSTTRAWIRENIRVNR